MTTTPPRRCAAPGCPYLGRWAAGYCPAHLPSSNPPARPTTPKENP